MTSLVETLAWFTDPVNWSGADGVPTRLLEHLFYCVVSIGIAAAVALPIGLGLGHTGRFGNLAINISNVGRAIPTFGVILLAVVLFFIGSTPIIIALTALAVPPILTNAYVGVRSVDPEVRDAAVGMGLRGGQVLRQVELPVALPLVMTGLRTSAVQVVATATIAGFAGGGGFGRYIRDSIPQRKIGELIAGALLVAALSMLTEYGLGLVQSRLVSDGLRGRARATAAAPAEQSRAGVAA